MMRKRSTVLSNIVFVSFFLLSLVGLLLYLVFFKEPILVSTKENRNLTNFQKLKETSFFDGSFQDVLDKAIADQFIYRYEIVKVKNTLDVKLSELFVPRSDNDYKLTPVVDTPIKRIGESYYLINSLFEDFDEDLERRFSNRAKQINELAKDYPEIGVFVYKPTQVHETDIFDEANELESFGSYYGDILKNSLKVPYDELKIETLEDYKNYFFQSDHHWSYQGSYQGYVDIVNLMFGEDEEVLQPIHLNTYGDSLHFAGTFASRVGYVYPSELFYLYTFDLPQYEVFVDDKSQKIHDMNTFEANLPERDGNYFYGVANPTYNFEVIYKSEYKDKETLLLVGDSYAAAVEPLLMEHFSTIHFIQPFDYYWKYGRRFDYDKFIAENKVDNILFMYTVENYFYSNSEVDRGELFDVYRGKGE